MAVPSSDLRRSLMEVNLANYELVMYLDKRLGADNGWLLTHAAALYGAARMAYFLLGSVPKCRQKAEKVLMVAKIEIKDVATCLDKSWTASKKGYSYARLNVMALRNLAPKP